MKLQAILAALFLLAASAAQYLIPQQKLADIDPLSLEKSIPSAFADWSLVNDGEGAVTSPDQDAYIKSIYSQVLNRSYVNKTGDRIMLSIAYTDDQSDNAGKQSHLPEICYPSQGFELLTAKKNILNTRFGDIPVKQLLTRKEDRVEPLTYWTMVGYHTVSGMLDKKLAQTSLAIKDIKADGLIFRVSSINADPEKAYKQQEEFIYQLLDKLDSNSRHRLAGLQ